MVDEAIAIGEFNPELDSHFDVALLNLEVAACSCDPRSSARCDPCYDAKRLQFYYQDARSHMKQQSVIFDELSAENSRLRGLLKGCLTDYPPVDNMDDCMLCGSCAYDTSGHKDDCGWKLAQEEVGNSL